MLGTDSAVDWQNRTQSSYTFLGNLQVIFARVKLLMLSALAREENKSCFISFQSFDIGGKRFGREILAARVDGDANGWSKLARDTSFLTPEYQRPCIIPSTNSPWI